MRRQLYAASRSPLLRAVGQLQVARVVAAACGAVQLVLLTRVLSPTEFGVLGLVWATASLARHIFDSRSSALLVRYCARWSGPEDMARRRAVIGVATGLDVTATLLGAAVIAACAPWLARVVLHAPGSGHLLLLGAAILLAGTGAASANAVLAVTGNFRAMALTDTVGAVATLTLALPVILWFPAVETLLFVMVASSALQTGLRFGFAGRELRRAGLWSGSDDLRAFLSVRALEGQGSELRRFVAGTNALATLKLVKGNLPALYLGAVLSPAAAAPYLLAQRIIERTASLVDPVHHVTFPRFARQLAADDPAGARTTYLRSIALCSLMLLPVVVAFGVLGPWSVALFFGPQYADAYLVITVAVIGYAVGASFLTRTALLTAAGALRALNLAYLAGIAVQLALLIGLVGQVGTVGASWALLGFHLTTVVCTLPATLRVLRRSPPPTSADTADMSGAQSAVTAATGAP